MCISIQNLAYMHPDKEVLFSNLNLAVGKGEKIALIGNNGSGKSTLLQILAGKLAPSAGNIHLPAAGIYYVPQHFGQYDDMTIAQAMQVDEKLTALHAIIGGDADEKHFAALNDDWNIEESARAALDFWGLKEFPLTHPIREMSGGEKTKVFLAGMKVHNESVILLDEPTNHLDFRHRKKLYNFILQSKSASIVVSHDRTLLNLLNITCELLPTEVKVYGGNYNFYKEQKDIALSALQQQLDEKEKELRLARKIARETAERQQKHASRGEKQAIKKGVPRIAMGNMKSHSEKTAGKLKDIHAEKTSTIQDELRNLRSSVPAQAALKTDFNSSILHTGKILVEAEGINFGYDSKLLWKEALSFHIRSGERILVSGDNGSGKTSLLKLIIGATEPSCGNIRRCDGFTSVYLDQEYSIVRGELSILEQAELFRPTGMEEHELKIILNRFLFPVDVWNKPCSKLSGGEKMRLTFCCLMVSNNTPDMFVLDEPTNNLDIQNIEIITSTLKQYAGTVLVVSHDRSFTQEIGVERELSPPAI